MTQTEAPAHQPDEANEARVEPPHVDPVHDIDGMKTTLAVTGTLAMIVFLFWAMTHLYNVMVQVERQKKIADAPTTEINEIRAEMREELAGNMKERGEMSIDEAIKQYLKDPSWRPKPK